MPTNPFFNNFGFAGEQDLLESLSIEAIRMYGIDLYYIRRSVNAYDPVYGEDPTTSYGPAFQIEMYIRNVEGFGGDGDFLSKFNLQIRDTMTFTVARRTFLNEVGTPQAIARPLEGDLIYFPLNQKTFVIKFVEHEPTFYQMGALQVWDLKCELFEYSNERFDTGIAVLDALSATYSFASTEFDVLAEDGTPVNTEDNFNLVLEDFDFDTQVGDAFEDNDTFITGIEGFVDFSNIDPFAPLTEGS